jgi:hypothetical protein
MVETPTIDRYMGIRAKESKRAFRELYQQHKLWLKAYKHRDTANIAKLAQERDAKARKALRAYREADRFFKGINGLWTVSK